MTKDEKTQADALSVVLSLQYVSAFHARAMAEESGFALLKRILLSPECKIGYHTLKVFSWSFYNQLSYFSLKGDKHPITFPLSNLSRGSLDPIYAPGFQFRLPRHDLFLYIFSHFYNL